MRQSQSILLASLLFLLGSISIAVMFDVPRIVRVNGFTSHEMSAWKAVATGLGLVTKINVSEKSRVAKGQLIAEISEERYAQNRSVSAEQARLAQAKLSLGQDELRLATETAQGTEASVRLQLDGMKRELAHTQSEGQWIDARLKDAYTQQERSLQLVKEGFISQEGLELRKADLLRLEGEKSGMQRLQLSLQREIERLTQELRLIELRMQSQKAQLNRELTNAQQEFNEHSSKRLQLFSPIDGIVSQVSASEGQMVRPDIPLLTVLPQDGKLEVILLLPSRSIGFVREGQRVSVRYQAFPHEHYGRHYGRVREIARVALPPQEVAQHIRVDEPVYTVRVSLPDDALSFEGKRLPITAGMVVEADVELDRLKIYQWLLEPLYRLGGRVA